MNGGGKKIDVGVGVYCMMRGRFNLVGALGGKS